MPLPTTCHADPWALVRRNGDQLGKRVSVRMVYLVGTGKGPDGKAVAMTGYVMNGDMTGWTKHPRPVKWEDVVKRWRRQPSVSDVRKAKSKLPVATETRWG
jgi:hypothetical protein